MPKLLVLGLGPFLMAGSGRLGAKKRGKSEL